MKLTKDNKEQYVKNLFSRIAGNYDKLNDIMTLSLHKHWKQKTVDLCDPTGKGINASREAKILDLCTGTGDMAFMWAKKAGVKEVIGLDSCPNMLEYAKKRQVKQENNIDKKIQFIEGDALKLPFEDNYFDAVTVGFGLRNVNDLKASIHEIKRVLKPGAFAASLDLGHPPMPIISDFYKKVFLQMIPKLGMKFAKDKDAYQYLVDSLKTWPNQKVLSEMFWDSGFSRSYFKNIMLGSIAIVVAEK